MADPVLSEFSIRSIEAQSALSVVSVGAKSAISSVSQAGTSVAAKVTATSAKSTSTVSTTKTAKHTPTTKVKGTGKSSSTTTKATHSHSSTAVVGAPNAHKGVSGGVIAAIVIIIIVVAAGAGFLFWRRRRQPTSRQRSGLWLENGTTYAGSSASKRAGDGSSKMYMFNGSGQNGVSLEPRPFSLLVPPPPLPPKEKDQSPDSPAANVDTALLSPSVPSSAHSPRPRTPELSPIQASATDPYAQVQNILTSSTPRYNTSPRPDSGPMVLYSTARQNDYFVNGVGAPGNQLSGSGTPQPTVLSSEPTRAAPTSEFAAQYISAASKPMPVPVPLPVPSSSTMAQSPQRLASPSLSLSTKSVPAPPSSPPPPAYAFQALMPSSPSSPLNSLAPPPPPPINIVVNNGVREQLAGRKVYAVIRTYVPTLLDELQISVGDHVIVTNEFDDGWAYCEKFGDPDGAAGVVPIECLDRSRDLSNNMIDAANGQRRGSHLLSPENSFASLSSVTASPTDPRLSTRFSSFQVDFEGIGKERI